MGVNSDSELLALSKDLVSELEDVCASKGVTFRLRARREARDDGTTVAIFEARAYQAKGSTECATGKSANPLEAISIALAGAYEAFNL